MDILECIKARRSVRKFKPELVEDDAIINAIDVARYYPSWKNSQTVRFILIKDNKIKSEIANNVLGFTHNTDIINNAPELIVVLTKKGRSGYERDGSATTSKGSHFESFDAGLATQNLMLALSNFGIGSVVLGIYDEDGIKKILNLDDGLGISCLIPIGYPDEEPIAPKRHEVKDILEIK